MPLVFLRRALAAALLLAASLLPAAPAAPDKVGRLIDLLFRSPEFEQGRLSPDGSHFAFIRQVRNQKVLDCYEFKTGKFYRLQPPTGAGTLVGYEQHIGGFFWLGPDQLLIEDNLSNLGVTGLWVANATLQKCQQLELGNKLFTPLALLPGNPGFAYLREVNSDGRLFTPLWRLNKRTLTLSEAEPNPGRVIDWDLDQSGQVRLATVAESDGATSYLYRAPGRKDWEPLPLPSFSSPVAWNASGQSLLVAGPGPGGRDQLQSFDLATRQFTGDPVSDPVYDLGTSVITDPRSGATVGMFYDAAKPAFHWLDPDYARTHGGLQACFPGATILTRGTLASGETLFSVNSDVLPPALYRFNGQKLEIHLVIAALPEAAKVKWAPMQPVSFTTRDGATVYGYLTLPLTRAADQKVPLVALSHGGPQVRDSWGFDPEVQFLAGLGYAVLQVNYRGSIGYGRAYALKNSVEVCEKSVDDVVDGIRWTIAQGYADPKRVVAFGGSYGGYISLGIATRYPDLLAAAVGFAGVYDWNAQLKENRKNYSDILSWRANYYIDPKSDLYHPFNPAGAAGHVRCPVLLLHGGSDHTVDIAQTNLMARALREAGKPVEVIKDAEGIHGLPNEEARRTFYTNLAAFLLKNVPPS